MAKTSNKSLVYNPDEDELKAETLPYDPSDKGNYDTLDDSKGGFSGALSKVFGNIRNVVSKMDDDTVDKMTSSISGTPASEVITKTTTTNNIVSPEKYQPKEFISSYDAQIQSVLDKILNGEKFDYDINTDAAYQQYRDMYERNAKKSFDNTFAALTDNSGGYANSYAGAVAQQGYNQTMQDVAAAMPTFEDRAYSKYRDGINDLYNQYSTLVGERANERAGYEYDTNLDYNMYLNDRNFDYQLGRDKLEDDWREKVYADERADADYSKSMNEALAAAQYGDYSLLGSMLGVNPSNLANNDKLNTALQVYSSTGDSSMLKEFGIDTSAFDVNNKLGTALSIYEATGDSSMLNSLGINTTGVNPQKLATAIGIYESTGDGSFLRELGIDTSVMDRYTNAKIASTGSSGGSGRASTSSSSGGGSYSGSKSSSSSTSSSSSGSASNKSQLAAAWYDYCVQNGVMLDTRTAEDWLNANASKYGVTIDIATKKWLLDAASALA